MSKTIDLEIHKNSIQRKGLSKISAYFDLDINSLKDINPEVLKHLNQMARLGMQFEKEMNLSHRATELNFIRVGRMITKNKDELKSYIKKTLPKYT